MALWLENARCKDGLNIQRDAYFKLPTFKTNKNIFFKLAKADITQLLTIFNRGCVKTDAKRLTKQRNYYVTLNKKHNCNPRTKHTHARSYFHILYSVIMKTHARSNILILYSVIKKAHHHGKYNKN